MGGKGAVFLDRDGTLVADPSYLHQPDRVELLPGVREGLGRLSRVGWPLVVVSNQSGIGRGMYGEEAFRAVMGRIAELLAPDGVSFTAVYYCPHHPEVTGPCECRKPGVALFERASREHGLDLGRSWYLGDRLSDTSPAKRLGGRGLLLARADSADARVATDLGIVVAPDLVVAAALIGPAAGAGGAGAGPNPGPGA
jgi:D-glycero-D-manno-heptose 1,7-bisphosphate phosphatase